MENNAKPLLVLLHGLHQSPLVMKPLANKLTQAGYQVYSFNYASVLKSLEQHSEQLHTWLINNHNADKPIYMVGHSLGGLVMRDFMARYPQWQIANCVTLGTPHLGSTTAKYSKKLLPFMVGKAFENGLNGDVPKIPEQIKLGIIAGNKAGGLGTPFLLYYNWRNKLPNAQKANDGTVFIWETRLPSASDHLTLPVSHTGMLMNSEVAQQTIYFLKHGCFNR